MRRVQGYRDGTGIDRMNDKLASSIPGLARQTAARPTVIGKLTGKVREADQVPGMPHAICHACGLGYKCLDADCPNEKPDPMFGGAL